MPYGISKEHGGDSPENVKRMKVCITGVMKDNPKLDEDAMIRICKSRLFPTKSEKSQKITGQR